MSAFTAPHFNDETEARSFLERLRWPNGPVCNHCGEAQRRYLTKREGRFRCGNPECRKDYSVTTGTVMERSHIPLTKWLMAFYLMCASKKGISAHQLYRSLGIGSYQSAWFMAHRIREAMRAGGLVTPMGGEGEIVEADETYYGRADEKKLTKKRYSPYTKGGWKNKGSARPIVSLVERGGRVRSFHVDAATKANVTKIVRENVAKESRLHTDESLLYKTVGAEFAAHETTKHSAKEYVRGDVHSNSVEGYFGLFKRGMKGVYHHCDEKHLHRYLAEFDFRYNHRTKLGYGDIERTFAAIRGAEGKRLTYRQPNGAGLAV
jgi:transposase-like protein